MYKRQLVLRDDDAVTDDTHLAVAGDLTAGDTAACDGANVGDLVDLTDLQLAQRHLAELGSQHTLHSVGDVVDGVIDDAVHTHLDLGGSGLFLRHVVGADVEADDDGVGCVGQVNVGLADGADTGVDDADADLVVGDLLEALLDSLGGALDVRLDDDGEQPVFLVVSIMITKVAIWLRRICVMTVLHVFYAINVGIGSLLSL